MFGFILGTACLIGLVKVLRRGAYGYGGCGYGGGYGGYGGGPGFMRGGRWGGRGGPWGGHGGRWGGHGGGYGGPFRGRGEPEGEAQGGWEGRGFGREGFLLRMLFEQIDATPGQEKVIAAAVREVREEALKSRDELRKTRGDIAKAMRGVSFDEVLFGELFARHDGLMESMRRATMGALGKVHEALDDKQRERVAELIERGAWH
jgi:hypothetical protein